jgi:hypothetical protein
MPQSSRCLRLSDSYIAYLKEGYVGDQQPYDHAYEESDAAFKDELFEPFDHVG